MKKSLSLLKGAVGLAVAIGSLATATAQVPAPLLYFDFEDTGESVADKTFNAAGYTGELNGDVSIVDGGAPDGASPGKAGEFLTGHLKVNDFDAVENLHGTSYTLACWLKPDFDALSGGSFIFGQGDQGIHNGVRVHASNGSIPALHTAHWGADASAETELVEDEWVHAVWTYDNDEELANIYLNGVNDLEDFTQRPPNGSGILIIGSRSGGQVDNAFTGLLDEIAVWDEVLSQEAITALAAGTAPFNNEDSDDDDLPDGYEIAVAGNLTTLNGDGVADADEDGLSDKSEFETHGTNPTEADSDGDSLTDGEEVAGADPRPATSPTDSDTDGDGLADNVETNTGTFVGAADSGTDPTKADTDGDEIPDGAEITLGSDPTDPDSKPGGAISSVPLAYFDFEGMTEDNVPDESGNGNNGEIVNPIGDASGAPRGSTPGRGGAFSLDGEGSYFDIVDLPAELGKNGDSYTLSAWLKPSDESLSGDKFLFGQTTQGIHNGLRGSGTLHTAHWGADSNASTPLDADTWYHALWTYDGDEQIANIYLNGEVDLEDWGQRPPNGGGNIIIGGRNGGTQNFQGCVDDVAIWDTVLRSEEIQALANGASPINATQEDTDGDGMTDSYEERNDLDPAVDDSALDKDGDGISNLDEFKKFLQANNPDTDGDTLSDGVESDTGVFVDLATDTGTNPLSKDTDRDGLNDNVETKTGVFVSATDRGTDPLKADTDGDSFEDGKEVDLGTDPLSAASFPKVPNLLDDLVGMDLTDPEDDGDPEADDGYDAIFEANEEPDFAGGENAFNVFDNIVGPGNDKWCCGNGEAGFPDEPIWVQATFEDPIVLSSFTVSSANDTVGRDPRVWEIQGSNDWVAAEQSGEPTEDNENATFETIFRQNDPDEAVWDARNQPALFTAGVHYPLPGAYTTIRFVCFETGLAGGARFQIGELEFFGEVGSVGPFEISKIERLTVEDREVARVTWPSKVGTDYAVESATPDVFPSDTWNEETDGVEGLEGTTSFDVVLPDPVPEEFYIRIIAQ